MKTAAQGLRQTQRLAAQAHTDAHADTTFLKTASNPRSNEALFIEMAFHVFSCVVKGKRESAHFSGLFRNDCSHRGL